MNGKEKDTATAMEAKAVKITPKALEERLQRAVNLWKTKLAKLTGTVKQVHQLKENEGATSLTEAKQLIKDFNRLLREFCCFRHKC